MILLAINIDASKHEYEQNSNAVQNMFDGTDCWLNTKQIKIGNYNGINCDVRLPSLALMCT